MKYNIVKSTILRTESPYSSKVHGVVEEERYDGEFSKIPISIAIRVPFSLGNGLAAGYGAGL